MCHLAYYPPGIMPVREHLLNGAVLNPHGCGFAIGPNLLSGWSVAGDDHERLVCKFTMLLRQVRAPALFHSRNATGDSPVTSANIHPFIVTLPSGKAAVAHNGYLFPHDGERSDSREFAEEILPRYDLDDAAQRALLEERMGPNKAVIIRQGQLGVILNPHLGTWLPDGSWHGNADYTGKPHLTEGTCPVCKAETDCRPVCERCEEKAQARRALLLEPAA